METFWSQFRAASRARREGQLDRALVLYETALGMRPEHGDALYYAAQLRYRRGDLARAVAYLLRLSEHEPRALRPWQQLSVVYGQPLPGWLPDLEAAARASNRALELNPNESRNHLLAARWAAYAGERERASAELEAALGHNPKLWQGYLLQLWMAPTVRRAETAARLRSRIAELLCGGELGRGPQCRAHAALHVALAAAAQGDTPLEVQPLVPEASPTSTGNVVAAMAANLSDLPARGEVSLRLSGGGELRLLGRSPGPALMLRVGAGRVEPAWVRADGWDSVTGAPISVPWRAVLLHGPKGITAVVAGGGERSLRAYTRTHGVLQPASVQLPHQVGSALAAADFDGDGWDDVFAGTIELDRGPDGQGPWAGGALLLAADGYRQPRPVLAGPITAAAAGDLDGDGDPDLLVASRPAAGADAGYLVPSDETAPAQQPSVVSAWRNDAGTLEPWNLPMPTVRGFVNDLLLADVTADRRLDLYIATGPPMPEQVQPDRWFVGQQRGFRDATPRLGRARLHSTQQAWIDQAGRVWLVRGGRVPAEPWHVTRVNLR